MALLERLARLGEARALLRQLVRQLPTYREGHRRLGKVCMALMSYRCADRAFSRALKKRWNLITARRLARVLVALGEPDRANKTLRGNPATPGKPGRKRRPLDTAAVRALERDGNHQEAIAAARKLVLKHTRHPDAHLLLGQLLSEHDEDAASLAEEHLVRASQLDPGRADTLAALGWLRRRQGKLARSRDLLAMASRLAPRDARILGRLAEVNVALGRSARAIELLKLAIPLSDDTELTARLRARLAQLERSRVVTK